MPIETITSAVQSYNGTDIEIRHATPNQHTVIKITNAGVNLMVFIFFMFLLWCLFTWACNCYWINRSNQNPVEPETPEEPVVTEPDEPNNDDKPTSTRSNESVRSEDFQSAIEGPLPRPHSALMPDDSVPVDPFEGK